MPRENTQLKKIYGCFICYSVFPQIFLHLCFNSPDAENTDGSVSL